QSQFDPSSYSGSQGALPGWLMQALQSGLLKNALGGQIAPPSPQDQSQTGPTYANGNQGMMGGVPFPIAGPAPMQDQSQLPPNAIPSGPAQMPQGQPQSPLAPQDPGIMDRLSAFTHNLGASGGIIPGIVDAIQGAATGQRLDPRGYQMQMMKAQINDTLA